MRPADPRRFLLRASALLILMLSVWWFGLQSALSLGMLTATNVLFGLISDAAIVSKPSGDWDFHVPVSDSPPAVLRRIGATRIDSLDFTVSAWDVATFTVGLPIYWAVALAIEVRPRIRALLAGSLAQVAIGVVSIAVFAQVNAYNVLARIRPDATAVSQWGRELTYYLVTTVVPYVSPLIVAVFLHPDLAGQILAKPAAGAAAGRLKSR
jgi:hypothetical protein